MCGVRIVCVWGVVCMCGVVWCGVSVVCMCGVVWCMLCVWCGACCVCVVWWCVVCVCVVYVSMIGLVFCHLILDIKSVSNKKDYFEINVLYVNK